MARGLTIAAWRGGLAEVLDHELDREEHGAGVEQALRDHLPDRADVAQGHVQRRQQHPDARGQHHQQQDGMGSSSQLSRGSIPEITTNTPTTIRFRPG